MTHSLVPPSSAHIWGKPDGCTGWPLMAQMFPQADDGGNGEDAEGTAAHEIGADIIKSYSLGQFNITPEMFVDKIAPNGVVYTEQMFEGALMYADDVGEVMRELGVFGGPHFGIEQQMDISNVHQLCFGTPDMWLYKAEAFKLYLWDFKFGYIVHEAFEHWQMLCYLAGLVLKLNINGIIDQRIKVHIRVVQPRANHRDGPIREWIVTLSDLRGYFNQLHYAAHKALSNDAELRTGDHCRHCTARHACEPALAAGVGLYEVAGRPVPAELSREALGVQLAIIRRAIAQLEYLESGYEEQIKNMISRGERVPGWCTEVGKGRLAWNKPIAEVIALGDMLGKDLRKPQDAITPTQAIKAGIDKTVIDQYSSKPTRGLKVVPDTNRNNKAKQVFSS